MSDMAEILRRLQEIENEIEHAVISSERKQYIVERLSSIESSITKPRENYGKKWQDLKIKLREMLAMIDVSGKNIHRDGNKEKRVIVNSDANSIKRMQLEYLLILMEEMESSYA